MSARIRDVVTVNFLQHLNLQNFELGETDRYELQQGWLIIKHSNGQTMYSATIVERVEVRRIQLPVAEKS